MSDSTGQRPDRPLQLMLIDEDPVFRLGLKVWLEQQGDCVVVAEAGTADEALAAVESRFQTYQRSLDDPALRPSEFASGPPLDLLILDLGLGASDPEATPGLQLCQQIKTEFPRLPVLVLSAQAEPVLQAAAERMGADGYGTRGMSVQRLAQLIGQIVAGTSAGSAAPIDPSQPSGPRRSEADQRADRLDTGAQSGSRISRPADGQSGLTELNDIPGPLTAMRISMRLSGQQQIDQHLSEVAIAHQRAQSWLQQAILDGKKRELIAARWLVSAIWQTPQFSDAPSRRDRSGGRAQRSRGGSGRRKGSQRIGPAGSSASTDWMRAAQQGGYGQNYADITAARYLDRDLLVPGAAAALVTSSARLPARPGDVQSVVFEGVFAKLQRPLKNVSQSPLEIDILRADKKLELLYLVLRQLEDLLGDLRASQVRPGQLSTRSSQVIGDLWTAVITAFFGKYYTVRVGNVEEEVVTLLSREKLIVQAQILDQIPLVTALFSHWLFQEPFTIESASYTATTPQAIAYSEQLLENLMIQVANAVIQPLLNRLADTEPIKKSLYTSRLMSSREIERFRNDLSWRYRWDRLINEPKAIFESRYRLYVLTPTGINTTAIYAPRRAELDRLSGLPLVVTLTLETRDAISPRLRTAIALFGSSVVYVLTEVLGRGIGLVGRGIFQGMGSAWQGSKAKQRRPVTPEPPSRYREDSYSQDFSDWE